MIALPEWLTWENCKALANSAFTTSLVGALAGASAGARAAQRITERAKDREQMLSHLRNTNAAIMVSFSICNAALALKKQHVQPMYDAYGRAADAVRAYKVQRATGQRQGNAEYQFTADFRTYPAPVVPIETLKDLVFQKVSAFGRPLALVSVLEQSLLGLRESVAKRDALIHRLASGAIPAEHVHHYYFGTRLPSGDTNQEYPDLVEAIHSYVDDVVFFSALLCSDLVAHGTAIHAAFTKQFGKGAPRVSTADFSGPRQRGLIPPDAQYADWINAFAVQQGASRQSQ